jgi:O-antigen/teichoic acid export membrane protein
MSNMLRDLIEYLLEDLLGDKIEHSVSSRLKGWLADAVPFALGITSLAVLYSGFADYEHYSTRGLKIFLLPATAVIIASVLYAACFRLAPMIDSKLDIRPVWFVIAVTLPMLVTFLGLIWIRERNAALLLDAVCFFACLLLFLMIFVAVVQAAEHWPSWLSAVLVVLTLAFAFFADKLVTPIAENKIRSSTDPLKKYEPFGFGRWK